MWAGGAQGPLAEHGCRTAGPAPKKATSQELQTERLFNANRKKNLDSSFPKCLVPD